MFRHTVRPLVLALMTGPLLACQSPSSASSTTSASEAVDVVFTPDPAIADQASGRSYRVPRNNEPDEIRFYDWHTAFTSTVSINSTAIDEDVDLAFPVKLSSATLSVHQASGGVVTPPSGGDSEKYEFVTLQATGNQFAAVNSSLNLTFELWYDLPSLRKEALVRLSLTLIDDDGRSFVKTAELNVAP